jgi:hypothetical protein
VKFCGLPRRFTGLLCVDMVARLVSYVAVCMCRIGEDLYRLSERIDAERHCREVSEMHECVAGRGEQEQQLSARVNAGIAELHTRLNDETSDRIQEVNILCLCCVCPAVHATEGLMIVHIASCQHTNCIEPLLIICFFSGQAAGRGYCACHQRVHARTARGIADSWQLRCSQEAGHCCHQQPYMESCCIWQYTMASCTHQQLWHCAQLGHTANIIGTQSLELGSQIRSDD